MSIPENQIQGKPGPISRRAFLGLGGATAAALMLSGSPLGVLGARLAEGQAPSAAAGYGPLVPKGELFLPAAFNYQVVDRQGTPMRDGRITPGIFDAMGAFPDTGGSVGGNGKRTILIRNHENREQPGEIKVVTGPGFEYDETAFGGCTKLVVEREKAGRDPATGEQLYEYTVVDNFAILGGTSTNCAGGELPFKKWMTCEEVVKRTGTGENRLKHGYNFEVDAMADGPVVAVPIPQMGRFAHEATTWRSGILYQTEDRSLSQGGACLYRYTPNERVGQSGNFAETTGPLEALAIQGSPRQNMDLVVTPGASFPVEWVPVPEPDHDDDTDNLRTRVPGFTPTRFQAQDNGAAFFDRQEGMWSSSQGGGFKIYFDCTTGGPQNLGQVWEYDPGREVLTLIYISTDPNTLQNPDNITIVPQTQDIFLCEDSAGEQFIRGVTQDGEIYNFARTTDQNDTEFCGACFSPDGQTLFVNQQGDRGVDESGQPTNGAAPAVTYAIYGPFEKREGANNKNFGNGPAGA
ncbi:MAG: PhoX family protein [Actinomycetota bacterium]|nr:PhoX family protein [Actinomycetota bacterium]